MTANGFQLQISGANGSGPIVISASSNLINWKPIFTNPAFIGTVLFLDLAATNFRLRFYRIGEQ